MIKKPTRKIHSREYSPYTLPPFLEGRVTPTDYLHWLNQKSANEHRRDLRLKRPIALVNSKAMYKKKIHQAVWDKGEIDPYTGDKLNWELISRQTPSTKYGFINNFLNNFALLPVIDHVGTEDLEFEICSWLINECKTCLTPDEFMGICKKVVDYRMPKGTVATNKRR
jgi:hypothetical protein